MLLYGIADLAFVGGSLVETGDITRWKRQHMRYLF